MMDTEVAGETTINTPVPHPEPATCRVRRAADCLREELAELIAVEGKLSAAPGTMPELHLEYRLGRLSGAAMHLLWTLAELDAARGR